MFKGKRVLCLIPARGGSKGLPKKSILKLKNKPLIAWTIESARAVKFFDKIVVSTDDPAIAAVAKKYGGGVPFLRPKALATDKCPMDKVIIHAIDYFAKQGMDFDLLVLLQPTSPLRQARDIKQALNLLVSKKAQAVVSVTQTEHSIYWANTLPKDNCMKHFIKPKFINKNRQELPVFYRINGAVYAAYTDFLKRKKSFFGNRTFAYIMPRSRSVDIDTREDFKYAEFLLRG